MEYKLLVTKASGEQSKFSEKKIRTSLSRAGATEEQIEFILKEINAQLYQGISTKKIYKLAFALLKGNSRHLAARYHLKQAIMELGPSGFPFEKYISEILKHQEYKTRVGEVLEGNCVSHEIDVIAEKENKYYIIECKYHNSRGIFCDVKIPLYINSRFKDIEIKLKEVASNTGKTFQGWVITNTRFSADAIRYGHCAGLRLIGWDFPAHGSLRETIDALCLYPVTCLTSLTKIEKQLLLDKNIVLCSEIKEKILESIQVKPSRIEQIMKEAQQLCILPVKEKE